MNVTKSENQKYDLESALIISMCQPRLRLNMMDDWNDFHLRIPWKRERWGGRDSDSRKGLSSTKTRLSSEALFSLWKDLDRKEFEVSSLSELKFD